MAGAISKLLNPLRAIQALMMAAFSTWALRCEPFIWQQGQFSEPWLGEGRIFCTAAGFMNSLMIH